MEPSLIAVVLLVVAAAMVGAVPARAVRRPGAGLRPGRVRGRRSRRRRATARAPSVELGRVLTEVAARLRSGVSVPQAWAQALPAGDGLAGAIDADGVPAALRALTPPRRRYRFPRGPGDPAALASQIAAAHVACRVAHTVGAPLAPVLDACAEGIAEAGRAESARRTALAGPKATARLLGWLPVAGLALGTAWGADPIGVLLGGGWGRLCLVGGLALMMLGHLWAARLVRSATTP